MKDPFIIFPVKEIAAAVIEQLQPYLDKLKLPPSLPPSKKLDVIYTRKEAANKLRISLPTLDKRTVEGKIVGYRLGVKPG